MELGHLIKIFKEKYGSEGDIHTYFAPGRVNLIGEHTDYNGGHVFPCALTIGTYGVTRKRSDRIIRFYSVNIDNIGVVSTSLDKLVVSKTASWTNYPKGVFWTFLKNGYKIETGMDILIYGDIPNGSGLSSSASLEVLVGLIIKDNYNFEDVSLIDIALYGQYAENKFVGANTGIMDQCASAMGKKDHAIFLDTNTLKYEYAPVNLPNEQIIIVNSKVKHSLVDSAYNERRSQCEEGLRILQKVVNISALGELSIDEFEAKKNIITDDIIRLRVKHAVYENQRTIQAEAALKRGDIVTFGKLLDESHKSLRYDYQVSCEEVDVLVDIAQQLDGVLGARITGGGFGGCTVNIVKKSLVTEFKEAILNGYKEKLGLEADIYIVDIGDGARKIGE
ncbi:MAG: galactokinase [Suipraeoptans sp.]